MTVFRSTRPDVEVGGTTLHEFVLARAAELANKPALIEGPSGRTVTYGALAAGVRQVAAGVAARGLRKGDTFALWLPNLPEWPLAALGAMAAGGVITAANPLYTPDELATQLANARARFLLTIPPFLDRALPAARTAGVEEVFVLGEAEGATSFATLLQHSHPAPTVLIDPARDLATLPYSSGTTGLPKGVMLTHSALVTNIRQTVAGIGFRSNDIQAGFLPFFHAIGQVIVLYTSLRLGATIVTIPRFDLEAFLATIQRYRISAVVAVPPVMLALAKHPIVDSYDLTSLRVIGSGGAPLGAEVQDAVRQRLGTTLVVQGWGMTELAAGSTLTDLAAIRLGACGTLVSNTEARVVDPATGANLGSDQTGEVWIRGPQVMAGYLGNPEATAQTIDADGWLHTGDLGYFTADGNLFVVDRLKELIKVKGFQVPPAELEALLATHHAVADVAVIGRPDAEAGEVPVAYVVPRGTCDPDQLMAWTAERVAPYKRLRAVVCIDQIPRGQSGKILRRLLLEQERQAQG
jgi:acyl-CoA synthetase (AMP-forming)/AMP-acid ligase II